MKDLMEIFFALTHGDLRPRGGLRSVRVLALSVGLLIPAWAGSVPAANFASFTVTPAAPGPQLVRTSLPLPRGLLGSNDAAVITATGRKAARVGLRVLSWHPATNAEPPSARRALVTFPHRFADREPVRFTLQKAKAQKQPASELPVRLLVEGESFRLVWNDGRRAALQLLAPPRTSREPPRLELVEENRFFRWQRLHLPDPDWPRVIEFRLDGAGGAVAVAHLQRANTNGHFAPDLGWELTIPARRVNLHPGDGVALATNRPLSHAFTNGFGATSVFDERLAVSHPTAPLKRRGGIEIIPAEKDRWTYRYLRCRATENVPMQPLAWQRAEIVLAPPSLAPLTSALNSPHLVWVEPGLWSALYGELGDLPALPPPLAALLRYHREAVLHSAVVGDDFGNVTSFTDGLAHGSAIGMNRLNHGAAIFEDGWRAADRRLTEAALQWCDNFYDQSIWWGELQRGGTRYNNVVAMQQTPPTPDYMWRSDSAVNFCTKGYDCFWLAWEETGDPRMKEALDAQAVFAAEHLHVNQGECRNIGDVRDFVRLYRFTGERRYLDEALRLFLELRPKLSPGHLFDQGGKPLEPDPPFIDEDQRGYTVGYVKPYIIGYALAGLPDLLAFAPDEPDLRETVRAVADFLATTVDPAGGWRYPHPRSSVLVLSQGLEHAWQLTQAARALGPEPRWLDAIETVLRARIHGWQRTGKILSSVDGWEFSTGKIKERKELYDLYQKPVDRDAARDYREGKVALGHAPPEGLVYFAEVLTYYLQHRPAARLLAAVQADEPLGQMLNRVPNQKTNPKP